MMNLICEIEIENVPTSSDTDEKIDITTGTTSFGQVDMKQGI